MTDIVSLKKALEIEENGCWEDSTLYYYFNKKEWEEYDIGTSEDCFGMCHNLHKAPGIQELFSKLPWVVYEDNVEYTLVVRIIDGQFRVAYRKWGQTFEYPKNCLFIWEHLPDLLADLWIRFKKAKLDVYF